MAQSSAKLGTKIKNILENKKIYEGSVYRQNIPPKQRISMIDKRLSGQKLIDNGYERLPSKPAMYEYVPPLNGVQVPISRLAHGLERTLFSPGVHRMRNPVTGELNFPKYLEKLHHPDTIDYDKMPTFKTPSADDNLHNIALSRGAKFKGSTSSISSTLSQLYFLLSRFRNIDVNNLSRYFQTQSLKFTPSQKLPSSFLLFPRDGTYSIDRYQPVVNTSILSSLGKSVERMITMKKDDFEDVFLKSRNSSISYANEEEAFNYLHTSNFILRSQLDCSHPDVGIFDLKTRATFPIRIFQDSGDITEHLSYKLDKLRGQRNSYEKEYYDMARSSFLRNSFQTRIGNMSGIFVVYHNTDEVFGYEFLPRVELEKSIYQSQKGGGMR